MLSLENIYTLYFRLCIFLKKLSINHSIGPSLFNIYKIYIILKLKLS